MTQSIENQPYNPINISTLDFIKFNKDVGTDYATVSGLPGWGKTHLTHMLTLDAIRNGAICVFPGDKFCEWRHFFNYPKSVKKITLVVPRNQEIKYFNFPDMSTFKIPFKIIELDYWDLDIEKLIPDGTKSEIFVIYDAHYRYDPATKTQNLWRRATLWVDITSQLNDRITNLDKAIVTPFHEAGILFKQKASDKHWHAIESYGEVLVECRKGYVQPIFVAQRPTEIEVNIRDKCLWHFYRKGKADKHAPKLIQKITPFASREEYEVTYGGLYIPYNRIDPFDEIKEIWKMIPRGSIPELQHEKEVEEQSEEYLDKKAQKEYERELRKRELEEKKENKLYILEKEAEYKMQLEELKAQKLLEKEELKKQQIMDKQLKTINSTTELLAKGIIILQQNESISINKFMQELNLTYFPTAKTIYENCKNTLVNTIKNAKK